MRRSGEFFLHRRATLATGWALAAGGVLAGAAPAGACGPWVAGVSPYGRLMYTGPDGQPAGIDVDLLNALAERSGCTLSIQVSSRQGVALGMAQGRVALSPSTLATPERAAVGALWPYARSPLVVLVPQGVAHELRRRADFDQRSTLQLVTVRGNRHGEGLDLWVQALRRQGRTTEVGDVPAALRALRTGRAHAFISAAVAVSPDMGDLKAFDWDPSGAAIGHLWVGHHVNADDRLRLQQALASLLADGSVDRLLERHLGVALARRVRWRGAAARG